MPGCASSAYSARSLSVLRRPIFALVFAAVLAAGCESSSATSGLEPIADPGVTLERLFPSQDNPSPEWSDCMYASPLAIESRGERQVLVAAGATLTALDAATGALSWQVELAPDATNPAFKPWIVATPVVVGEKLVVAFQRIRSERRARVSHHVAVIDLEERALDREFPELELQAVKPSADGDDVEFSPANAVSRATLVHADVPDRALGLVYVSFGNSQDIQPWHGWVFELDLDPWQRGDTEAAISAVLLTTPETECGEPGESGSDDMVCGAGVWSPAGPKLVPSDAGDGYELIVPTGNGLLDLARRDYANSLLRTGRGLSFEPACDPDACSEFDPMDPQPACVETCQNLFVPRLLPGDSRLRPENGACDDLSMFECYAKFDWDLGANSPAKVELSSGRSVFVLPAKDGAVYLLDAEHMGTLYDRKQVATPCGTATDKCKAHWAGMMVTEPLVVEDRAGEALALLSTFVFDTTHPAGVVALRIEDSDDGPHFTTAWQAPDFRDPVATRVFRHHTPRLSRIRLGTTSYAFAVDITRSGNGTLLGIRARDGAIVAVRELTGPGQRFVAPLAIGDRLYVPSCNSDTGPSHLEGFQLSTTR